MLCCGTRRRSAQITGGSRGIGEFAENGYHIFASVLREPAALTNAPFNDESFLKTGSTRSE
jgi:hypothetical protein